MLFEYTRGCTLFPSRLDSPSQDPHDDTGVDERYRAQTTTALVHQIHPETRQTLACNMRAAIANIPGSCFGTCTIIRATTRHARFHLPTTRHRSHNPLFRGPYTTKQKELLAPRPPPSQVSLAPSGAQVGLSLAGRFIRPQACTWRNPWPSVLRRGPRSSIRQDLFGGGQR